MLKELRTLRIGLALALSTLLFGFGLGITFGAAEEGIKEHLEAEAEAVITSVYEDEAAAKKIVAKSWVYFKRAHLHANGLGTASLALILLLCALPGPQRLRQGIAIASGTGALGYSLFWMLAALRAPGLGSTGSAKASLAWLALPSSALIVASLVAICALFVRAVFFSTAGSQPQDLQT